MRSESYVLPSSEAELERLERQASLYGGMDFLRPFLAQAPKEVLEVGVVAYDMVHDGIWFSPEKPTFARLLRAVLAVMRERGMEPSQGLHLGPRMIDPRALRVSDGREAVRLTGARRRGRMRCKQQRSVL